MKAAIFRKEHFNAAHRLHNPHWSDERNREVFGKCNNPHYHGHNYEIVVKVTGDIDPETGYVMDTKVLKDIIREQITNRFDHQNLNLDVPEFARLNPTAEHIARVCWDKIRPFINPECSLTIYIYETERNYVVYPAD